MAVNAPPAPFLAAKDAAANPYAQRFHAYVTRGVAQILGEVRAAEPLVPVEMRQQAWHLLSYALRLPLAWPPTRDLLLALAPKMEQAGLRDEWIPYLERGVEQSRAWGDRRAEAEFSLHIGYLYTLRGKFAVARHWLEVSLWGFEALNDRDGRGTALNRLATVARRQQQYQCARDFVQAALECVHEDAAERANSFVVLGEMALDERNWVEAEQFFRQSLTIWEQHGDTRRIAWGLHNLGPTLVEQRKYDEAEICYKQAICLLESLQDNVNLAITQMNLGILYSQTSRPRKALALYKQAESIFRQTQNELSLAMVYNNMAIDYRMLGKWRDAEQVCLASVELWKKMGDLRSLLNVVDELGLAYIGQKKYEAARKTLQEALIRLEQMKNNPGYERLSNLLTAHLCQAIQESGSS